MRPYINMWDGADREHDGSVVFITHTNMDKKPHGGQQLYTVLDGEIPIHALI